VCEIVIVSVIESCDDGVGDSWVVAEETKMSRSEVSESFQAGDVAFSLTTTQVTCQAILTPVYDAPSLQVTMCLQGSAPAAAQDTPAMSQAHWGAWHWGQLPSSSCCVHRSETLAQQVPSWQQTAWSVAALLAPLAHTHAMPSLHLQSWPVEAQAGPLAQAGLWCGSHCPIVQQHCSHVQQPRCRGFVGCSC